LASILTCLPLLPNAQDQIRSSRKSHPDDEGQLKFRDGLESSLETRGTLSKSKWSQASHGASAYNPTLGRLKQENYEFEVSLGYTVRPCFKTKYKNGVTCVNPSKSS
jgi:hypothetical protein